MTNLLRTDRWKRFFANKRGNSGIRFALASGFIAACLIGILSFVR